MMGSLSFVGVMFTFLLLFSMIITVRNVDSMPVRAPKQLVLYTGGEDYTDYSFDFPKQKHLEKIRETDRIVLRVTVVIIGILTFFVMIICPCVAYCCTSWAVLQTAQPNLNRTSWNDWILRKFRSQRKRAVKDINDLPPSYEVILAFQEDQLAVRTVVEDEDPPSYTDALLNIKSGAL